MPSYQTMNENNGESSSDYATQDEIIDEEPYSDAPITETREIRTAVNHIHSPSILVRLWSWYGLVYLP